MTIDTDLTALGLSDEVLSLVQAAFRKGYRRGAHSAVHCVWERGRNPTKRWLRAVVEWEHSGGDDLPPDWNAIAVDKSNG